MDKLIKQQLKKQTAQVEADISKFSLRFAQNMIDVNKLRELLTQVGILIDINKRIIEESDQ